MVINYRDLDKNKYQKIKDWLANEYREKIKSLDLLKNKLSEARGE